MFPLSLVLLTFFIFSSFASGKPNPAKALEYHKYTHPHSLGSNYSFNPRDGWEAVNVTDSSYKYRRDKLGAQQRHGRTGHKTHAHTGIGDVAKSALAKIKEIIKGVGRPEVVTITWYTGHDLLNPSCWANSEWAPSDESFACALTMSGWIGRPHCFKFLELCSSPTKCVFVRVVDTCAGCARGSKHVDLTKAAFSNLADLDKGVLRAHMRVATEPEEWFDFLWGPRHHL